MHEHRRRIESRRQCLEELVHAVEEREGEELGCGDEAAQDVGGGDAGGIFSGEGVVELWEEGEGGEEEEGAGGVVLVERGWRWVGERYIRR